MVRVRTRRPVDNEIWSGSCMRGRRHPVGPARTTTTWCRPESATSGCTMQMEQPAVQRLLLAESSAGVRDALRRYLQRHALQVVAARDAETARAALDSSNVDMTVIDITLPGDDGYRLCADVKATSYLAKVFVADSTDESGRADALGLANERCVTKPFNPRQLLAHIRAALTRCAELPDGLRQGPNGRLHFAEWTLDTSSGELIGPAGTIDLGIRECGLLTDLARHSGQILTHQQLRTLSRARGARAGQRDIDTRIARLRRIIEPDPERPRLLRSHWGGAYSLGTEVQTS